MYFRLLRKQKAFLVILIFFGFLATICSKSRGILFDKNVCALGCAHVVVNTPDAIQTAIESLPKNGGTIFVQAQTYILRKGIHINRSNVTIIGEKGVKFRLADHINQPVILIGTDEEIPKTRIKNISLSNLEIDGNGDKQDYELSPGRLWLRGNGIDVRMVDNLWIEDVDISNTISGGLVISWDSHKVFVKDSIFHNNVYDGIAFYSSSDIVVSSFMSYDNKAAGISLDNNLKNVVFSNGIVKNNKDVGIFARESSDVSFTNLVISGSGSHGCFLSHMKGAATNTGISRFFFSGCSFLDNNGWGFWLAAIKEISPDNVVASSLFSGNKLGAINIDDGGSLDLSGNILQARDKKH